MSESCDRITSRLTTSLGAYRYPPTVTARLCLRSYIGADYAEHANEGTLTFAMIETTEALDNLGEIMSAFDLGAVYLGLADLIQSPDGFPAADWEKPR